MGALFLEKVGKIRDFVDTALIERTLLATRSVSPLPSRAPRGAAAAAARAPRALLQRARRNLERLRLPVRKFGGKMHA